MVRAEVQLAWKTQAGHRHNVEGLDNEDAVFVTHQHPLFDAVLMVADGMGGHPRPREASEVAVRTAREHLFDSARLQRAPDPPRLLQEAVRAAHEAVRRLRTGPGKPPGTTLSVAVVAGGTLYVAHVGDGSVYLMREGRVRGVAGGEDRRAGNRPAQFLGQEDPLELEQRQVELAAGDRLLLCTDGLTRYFREAGPEALERVVGRAGVQVQAIANQLTAHSRPYEYDDDTTVALAEVTGFAAARPVPARELQEPTMPELIPQTPKYPPAAGPSVGQWIGAAVVGAALLAAGFAAGRYIAPAPGSASGPAAGAPVRQPASAADLQQLPPGNLVLLDALGRRVYTLPTRGGIPGNDPVELQAFRVGTEGRFEPAGRFRLDPGRGVLTDGDGRQYPVDVDFTRGTVQVLRGGALVIRSRPAGAAVYIDGKEVGKTPQQITLTAGPHRVRVEGRSWTRESRLEVVPGGSVTLNVGP